MFTAQAAPLILGFFNEDKLSFFVRSYIYDTESSLYYLQSRYYDPALGRFINADAYPSTGQGLTGNNMFAYCVNNPVNGCDPCGACFHRFDFWNDCEKCKATGSYCFTFSVGVSGSVNIGPYTWGLQISITLDSEGYGALQWGGFGGVSGGPDSDKLSVSASPFAMVTNASGYDDLNGEGLQFGGTLPPFSIDYVEALDATGQEILYSGISVGGLTTSPDAHVFGTYTTTLFATEWDWDAFRWATQY